MNGDQKCEGEITWQSKVSKSAIDFVLVNQCMYDKFRYMKIDENKEKTDLSDHNIVSATFSVLCNQEDQYSETKEIKYLKINDDTKNKFLQDIEEYIRGDEQHDLNEFENVMKKACEDNIMRIIKRKGKHKNVEEIEPVWLTQGIKKQISIRRNYNKQKRKNMKSFTDIRTGHLTEKI